MSSVRERIRNLQRPDPARETGADNDGNTPSSAAGGSSLASRLARFDDKSKTPVSSSTSTSTPNGIPSSRSLLTPLLGSHTTPTRTPEARRVNSDSTNDDRRPAGRIHHHTRRPAAAPAPAPVPVPAPAPSTAPATDTAPSSIVSRAAVFESSNNNNAPKLIPPDHRPIKPSTIPANTVTPTPNPTPNSATASASPKALLAAELADVKALNAKLLKSLLDLTENFRLLEQSRDTLQKRISEVEARPK